MSDTDKKAAGGMMTFVLTIFVIALIVALIYFVAFHPAAPVVPGKV